MPVLSLETLRKAEMLVRWFMCLNNPFNFELLRLNYKLHIHIYIYAPK